MRALLSGVSSPVYPGSYGDISVIVQGVASPYQEARMELPVQGNHPLFIRVSNIFLGRYETFDVFSLCWSAHTGETWDPACCCTGDGHRYQWLDCTPW